MLLTLLFYAYGIVAVYVFQVIMSKGFRQMEAEDRVLFVLAAVTCSLLWVPFLIYFAIYTYTFEDK